MSFWHGLLRTLAIVAGFVLFGLAVRLVMLHPTEVALSLFGLGGLFFVLLFAGKARLSSS